MIQYSLVCDSEHKFDAWFRNAEAYDVQHKKGIVTCPICGTSQVTKALMAPAVSVQSRTRDAEQVTAQSGPVAAAPSAEKVSLSSGHPDQAELRATIKALREKLTSEADYVGDRFASEARKIHDNEAPQRGIYGEATSEEVAGLVEDGIDFMPIPNVPEDHN